MTKKKVIPLEHERRFVPDMARLPFVYDASPSSHILQLYLEDGAKTRIRMEEKAGVVTCTRTRKKGKGVSRFEDEREISLQKFAELRTSATCGLTKMRYFVTHEGVNLELNIFHGILSGYVQIEVEFETGEAAHAFKAPIWLGREVTHDSLHGNFHLAKYGKPE